LIKRFGRKTEIKMNIFISRKKLVQVCKIINAKLFQDQAPLKLFFTELEVNQC